MQELIEFLQVNSTLVLANPLAFATLAVLFGSGGFWVGRYFLAERIANLESRIAKRDEEIAELKQGRSTANELELPAVPIMAAKAEWGDEESAMLAGGLLIHTEEELRLSQS